MANICVDYKQLSFSSHFTAANSSLNQLMMKKDLSESEYAPVPLAFDSVAETSSSSEDREAQESTYL